MSRDYPQMRLRMPPELQARVHEHAKKNRRSINSELNFLIETALNELAPAVGAAEAGINTNHLATETCDAKYSD